MHINETHLLHRTGFVAWEEKNEGRDFATDCGDNPAFCLIEVQSLQWTLVPMNNALEVDDTYSIRGRSD